MRTRRHRREDDDEESSSESMRDDRKHRRPWVPIALLALLVAIVLAALLWGLITGLPAPQRLALQSNQTQSLAGANVWTDVPYQNVLLASGNWFYTPSQAQFRALSAGSYYVEVALGVVYTVTNQSVSDACSGLGGACGSTAECCGAYTEALCVDSEASCVACPAAGAACTSDADCCQNGLSPSSSICLNATCVPCAPVGGSCSGQGSVCCGAPGLACNLTSCYATLSGAATSLPTRQPAQAATFGVTAETSCVNLTVQAQLVRQAGGVGPFVTLATLDLQSLAPLQPNFLGGAVWIQAAVHDVYKIQWSSVCPLLALEPQPFDYPLLSIALQREPLVNASAVLSVRE